MLSWVRFRGSTKRNESADAELGPLPRLEGEARKPSGVGCNRLTNSTDCKRPILQQAARKYCAGQPASIHAKGTGVNITKYTATCQPHRRSNKEF